MKNISEIMEKNLMSIDILCGVRKIQNIYRDNGIEYFVVYDGEKLAGLVSSKELVGANQNRIVADIKSDKYLCVDCCLYLWEVKEVFDLNTHLNVIFVKNQNKIEGYITRATLNIELAKHTDLLTGLYKKDYLYYNASNLIRNGKCTTVLFIDVDNFGIMNKKYGHINGDYILKKVADLLVENIDSESYLCRYAGDEFAIVTFKNIEESKKLGQRIVDSIKACHFHNDILVSVSIGITGLEVKNRQIKSISGLINKLINKASLSSTRAKQDLNESIIIGNFDLDAIA